MIKLTIKTMPAYFGNREYQTISLTTTSLKYEITIYKDITEETGIYKEYEYNTDNHLFNLVNKYINNLIKEQKSYHILDGEMFEVIKHYPNSTQKISLFNTYSEIGELILYQIYSYLKDILHIDIIPNLFDMSDYINYKLQFIDERYDVKLDSFNKDPDKCSYKLFLYTHYLYNKRLPNGDMFYLCFDPFNMDYKYRNIILGNDSITTHYINYKNYHIIDTLDKRKIEEEFNSKTYNLGGEIIFPKHVNSINQRRGTNKIIADRFDLTLECIKRFYNNEKSPLYDVLIKDKDFFDLFINFKGYVDFFFLNDLVDSSYNVIPFIGNLSMLDYGLTKSIEEYNLFLNRQLEFVNNRCNRIKDYIKNNLDNYKY